MDAATQQPHIVGRPVITQILISREQPGVPLPDYVLVIEFTEITEKVSDRFAEATIALWRGGGKKM